MSNKVDFGEIEEGEIDFDASFDDIYTPLERPIRNDTVIPREIIESDPDDDNSSSTDSDTSFGKSKIPKVKRHDKPSKPTSQKPNKNKLKIWCNVLEDESVSNNLTDCNLGDTQMRIRGFLPYQRRFDYDGTPQGNQNSNAGKRNHAGQFVSENKYFKDNNKPKPKQGAPKHIPPLSQNVQESDVLLANEIANNLNEVKIDIILKAIQIAGKEKIVAIFDETRETEKSGGLLVMNGSRRRTPGGVFFYILKTSTEIPQEQLKQIFHVDKQDANAQKKKAAKKNKCVPNLTETNKADAGFK